MDHLKCLYRDDRFTLSCTVCQAESEHPIPTVNSVEQVERLARDFQEHHRQCLRAKLEGIDLRKTARVVPRSFKTPKGYTVNIQQGTMEELRAFVFDTTVALLAAELETCENRWRRRQIENAIATIQEVI